MSESLAASSVFHALGLALVHFVWQGAVIALLTAGALALLARASASVRYVVACVGLLSMVLTPAMTGLVATQVPTVDLPTFWLGGTVVTTTATSAVPAVVGSSGLLESTRVAIERGLPLIVLGWALCVMALSGRLVIGWLQAEQIKRGALRVVPDAVQSAVTRLARELGLKRVPGVAESSLVDVPAVIGWLRPLILLPASALGQLSPWQMEAILAHEIAHVRRHDYFVNALQCLAETLFFYHPAVWWLSSRVREEREHCCDDVAVAFCGDRLNYARALTTLEASRHTALTLSVAATGGPLLVRVRRLLGQPEPVTRPISVAVVAATMLLIVAARATGYSAPASPQTAGASVTETPVSARPASADQSVSDGTEDFLQGQIREVEQNLQRAEAERPVDARKVAQLAGIRDVLRQRLLGQTLDQYRVAQLGYVEALGRAGRVSEAGTGVGQQALSPDEAGVLAAEDALRLARLRGDAATLDRLLHSSSIDTRQNGATYDKRGEIALFSRRFLTSVTVGPSTINVQGNTATVSGSQVEVSASGADVVVFTRTWTRDAGGAWTMLSGSQFKDPRTTTGSTAVAPDSRLTETVNVQGQRGVPPPPPPPPPAGASLRVGGDVKEPIKLKDVRPVYPKIALASKVQGLVILEVVVDAQGNVTSPRVLRGIPMLDQAALDAVLQWKYVPPTLNGEAVRVVMTVTVNFMLPTDATATVGTTQTGGDISAPKKIRDVRPVYPADAQAAGVQGIVVISATVNSEGNVSDVRVLRGTPMLDQAAVDAVKQWKYVPAQLDGQPVAVELTLMVNFTLPNSQ